MITLDRGSRAYGVEPGHIPLAVECKNVCKYFGKFYFVIKIPPSNRMFRLQTFREKLVNLQKTEIFEDYFLQNLQKNNIFLQN